MKLASIILFEFVLSIKRFELLVLFLNRFMNGPAKFNCDLDRLVLQLINELFVFVRKHT